MGRWRGTGGSYESGSAMTVGECLEGTLGSLRLEGWEDSPIYDNLQAVISHLTDKPPEVLREVFPDASDEVIIARNEARNPPVAPVKPATPEEIADALAEWGRTLAASRSAPLGPSYPPLPESDPAPAG